MTQRKLPERDRLRKKDQKWPEPPAPQPQASSGLNSHSGQNWHHAFLWFGLSLLLFMPKVGFGSILLWCAIVFFRSFSSYHRERSELMQHPAAYQAFCSAVKLARSFRDVFSRAFAGIPPNRTRYAYGLFYMGLTEGFTYYYGLSIEQKARVSTLVLKEMHFSQGDITMLRTYTEVDQPTRLTSAIFASGMATPLMAGKPPELWLSSTLAEIAEAIPNSPTWS